MNKFIELIHGFDFNDLYEVDSANEAFNWFDTKLMECYNSALPTTTKHVKGNKINSPWISLKLKRASKGSIDFLICSKEGRLQKDNFTVIPDEKKMGKINNFTHTNDKQLILT